MNKQHIPEKLLGKIQPLLGQGEMLIDAKQTGIFGGGDISALTNQRYLLIGKSITETQYLHEGESFNYFEWQQDFGPVAGWVYVLTNQRFLVINLSDKKWLVADYPLAGMSGLFVVPVLYLSGALTYYHRGFKISFENGKEQMFYQTGPIFEDLKKVNFSWKGDDQIEREKLPRRICELANLTFSPPHPGMDNKDNELKFYVKSDLIFPQSCSSCLKVEDIYQYDIIDPSAGIAQNISEYATLFGVKFEIPYCESCYQRRFGSLMKDRAIKSTRFDFLVASLKFENRVYAELFLDLNSK